MCGRFVFKDYDEYIDLTGWHWSGKGPMPWPSYNIAPTNPAPVVTNERPLEIQALTWWLYPHWQNDGSTTYQTFNARSDGLEKSRLYSDPLRKRRCIVLASGWFEWTGPKGARQPYYITVSGRPVIPFAGLWNQSHIVDKKTGRDEHLGCCTIITSVAHPQIKHLHNRMPVVLAEDDLELWLAPREVQPQEVAHLLQPREADSFDFHRVGKITGDSERNIQPID